MNLLHAFRRMSECRSLVPFYRQWAVSESGGLSLSVTLDSLAKTAPPAVEERVACLREALSQGGFEPDKWAFGFTEVERAFIRVGVESGSLEDCLLALASLYEADWRAVRRARKKMAYPLFVALCACWIPTVPVAITAGVSAWVALGMLGTTALFFFGGAAVLACFRWLRSRPKEAQARFLQAMATAMDAGIDSESALALAVRATAPSPLARQRRYLKAQGRPLAEALQIAGGFEPAVLSMIDSGEQAGQLPLSLRSAARYLEGGTI